MKNKTKNQTFLIQKLLIVVTSLLLSFQTNGQEFDKWSLDLGAGVQTIGAQINTGYSAKIFGQGNLGVRYMFNEKFGLRLDLGYNKIEANSSSLPFSSNYYRASVQGVINVGNVLKFNTWTNRINLLAHGGIGIGILNNTIPVVSGNEFTVPISLGITPQFKISERIAIFADFSSIIHENLSKEFSKFKIKKVQLQYNDCESEVYKTVFKLKTTQGISKPNYEIVVKAKKDKEYSVYEFLFDVQGNIIKKLKFKPISSLNLEF